MSKVERKKTWIVLQGDGVRDRNTDNLRYNHAEVSQLAHPQGYVVRRSAEEAAEYLASYGLPGNGLDRLVNASYRLQGLMSFLTAGETEVRLRPLRPGQAA